MQKITCLLFILLNKADYISENIILNMLDNMNNFTQIINIFLKRKWKKGAIIIDRFSIFNSWHFSKIYWTKKKRFWSKIIIWKKKNKIFVRYGPVFWDSKVCKIQNWTMPNFFNMVFIPNNSSFYYQIIYNISILIL